MNIMIEQIIKIIILFIIIMSLLKIAFWPKYIIMDNDEAIVVANFYIKKIKLNEFLKDVFDNRMFKKIRGFKTQKVVVNSGDVYTSNMDIVNIDICVNLRVEKEVNTVVEAIKLISDEKCIKGILSGILRETILETNIKDVFSQFFILDLLYKFKQNFYKLGIDVTSVTISDVSKKINHN